MKKVLVALIAALVFCVVASFSNTASASTSANVPIGTGTTGRLPEKYYGNGVYCNQFTCRVNWGQSWTEGVQRWGNNLFGSFSGSK